MTTAIEAHGLTKRFGETLALDNVDLHVEELDLKARTHTTVARGPFTPCNHTWTSGADADFKSCASAASAHDSVVHLSLMAQGALEDPFWASCSQGCCVAM